MARGKTLAEQKHMLDCKEACFQHPFVCEHVTVDR